MHIYGHRGAKGEAPENTLAGFRHAYRHGVRRFEMDILLSSDGVPMVIHDLSLERTTGNSRAVAKASASEMGDMDARQNTTNWHHTTGVPTLDQVVAACPDSKHLQLEVKNDDRKRLNRLCNRLVEWIQKENLYQRITLTSSNAWFLRAARRLDRRISLGYVAERRYPPPLRQARRLECSYLCCNSHLCQQPLVAKAHRYGMHVSAWTVNRIHDMLVLEKSGVDSIITDYPTSALMYFENRYSAGGFHPPDDTTTEAAHSPLSSVGKEA